MKKFIPLAAALVVVPLVGGCATSPPDVDPGRLVADAASLDDAIALRNTPDPLDAEDALPGTLTRAAAGELAVRNSPDVQAALAEVRAALADAQQARLLSNPVLDLNVRFGGESEVIEAGLSQPLIDLLTRPARSRAADARLRAAAQRAVLEAIDVVQLTERAYAEAVAAAAQLDLLDEQAALLDQLLDVAEARQQAGEATRLAVVGFEARRAALNTRAINVRAQERTARLTLARLIGRPSDPATFNLQPATVSGEVADERLLILGALEARPEILGQRFELAALGEQVTLAGLGPFDPLAAGAELEAANDTEVGPSVTLPIPIFDFGTTGKERARAEVLAARHRLTGIARRVVEEVRQARAAVLAADETVAAVEDTLLPLQRDRVEQTRAAYRAGFADVTDVLAAEGDLLSAQAELIDARLRREVADVDLRRAVGGVAADGDDLADTALTTSTTSNQGNNP